MKSLIMIPNLFPRLCSLQLFAPDMPLMIAEFLKERDMLLRGLAHPLAMGVSMAVLSY